MIEIRTNELVIYEVMHKEVKDETSAFKDFRSKVKSVNWINALLAEHDVVIFYKDEEDGLEKQIIGTMKDYNKEAFDLPSEVVTILGEDEEVVLNVPFVSLPDKVPYYIHINDITKIITKNDNITEISKKTVLF